MQELRVITQILRRASMDRGFWRRKVLLATDSKVALGAVWKGRSSAPPLLRQCRIMRGVSLALQIRVVARWLESERNNADGPSRLLGVGAAPETIVAHRDRVDARRQR